MTAYVESNFVRELALEQEQCDSCNAIVQLANRGRVLLAVPAFSLAEPHVAIAGKQKARNQLRRNLDAHVRDLARSKQHRTVPTDFAALAAILAASAQFESDRVRDSIAGLLQTPKSSRLMRRLCGRLSTYRPSSRCQVRMQLSLHRCLRIWTLIDRRKAAF